jgi:hypothetical protein
MNDIQATEEVSSPQERIFPSPIRVVGKDPRQVEPGTVWPGQTWSDPEST